MVGDALGATVGLGLRLLDARVDDPRFAGRRRAVQEAAQVGVHVGLERLEVGERCDVEGEEEVGGIAAPEGPAARPAEQAGQHLDHHDEAEALVGADLARAAQRQHPRDPSGTGPPP